MTDKLNLTKLYTGEGQSLLITITCVPERCEKELNHMIRHPMFEKVF